MSSARREVHSSNISSSRHEPISDAQLGEEVARACRIALELPAKVGHVDAQVMSMVDVRGPPYPAQEVAMREHLAGVHDEMGEQSKLDRREMHGFTVSRHEAIRQVDADVAELHDRDVILGRAHAPAKHGA